MICFCRSGTSAAPISTPRSPAGDHHRVGDVEDRVELGDRLLQLDLRDHPGLRARRLDARLERGDVEMAADERLRDVVDAEPEREVEVGEILLGEGRHRQRDARAR